MAGGSINTRTIKRSNWFYFGKLQLLHHVQSYLLQSDHIHQLEWQKFVGVIERKQMRNFESGREIKDNSYTF